MATSLLRKVVRGTEFWIVRDGCGGYVINDSPSLTPIITNQTYSSVHEAYAAAYDWIIKGVIYRNNV